VQATLVEPKQREAQGRASSPPLPELAPDDGAEAKMPKSSSKMKYFEVQLNRESTGFERAKLLKDFREEDWKQLLQNVVKEHVQLYRDFQLFQTRVVVAHRHILSAFDTVTKDGQDQWQHLALDADIDDLFIEDAAPDVKTNNRQRSAGSGPQEKYIGIRLAPSGGAQRIQAQRVVYIGNKPTAPARGSGGQDRARAISL